MKYIVFCADGTWNGQNVDEDDDGVPDATNVLKAFHLLQGDTTLESRRLKDESEKVLGDPDQPQLVAKYLHGVGDSDNRILKVLGGAFGAGMIGRIVRGYTFISRHYQAGDRIVILGFSRGAYTARALAGMISSVGLLDSNAMNQASADEDGASPKEQAYRMGVSAWLRYREDAKAKQPNLTLRQRLAELITSVPLKARTAPLPDTMVAAPIHAVAVWDTVGALGIPNLGSSAEEADAFRFANDQLSANVTHGLHAVSFDEQRASFAPTLWRLDGERIQQKWFGGAHADVGGGYPERESGLSNIALKWIVDELSKLGVPFKPLPEAWLLDIYGAGHEPWKIGLFAAFAPQPRDWGDHPVVEHETLITRRQWILAGMPSPVQPGATALA
ncbi:DUF2235 domain-containing protein [Aquabacterium sp.]|uniref:DUF2235 domain-containing protein n=1 Tax=Aquabacterium sp. TaxID=1872578 RepID=UPI003D6C976C